MSIEVNWDKSGSWNGIHIQTQEYGQYVLLDSPSLTALGLPNDGTQKFATLSYVVNPPQITLDNANITLGAVSIRDNDSGATAQVTNKGLKVDNTQLNYRKDSPGVINIFTFLSAGRIIENLVGTVGDTGTYYVQIFDRNTTPTDGATPLLSIVLDAPSSFSLDYGLQGLPLDNGLTVAVSTTFSTLTKAPSAILLASVTYRLP